MVRQPRFDLPGVPPHIVQRGNNRLTCFLGEADRARHLHLMGDVLLATSCRLHAYVLMDNHVHMLATPPEVGAVARLMQKLGRQYVGQFNARHRRSGTLWEGRYKACLVDSADYLLRCVRYIDLNPIRARIIDDPVRFRWSSCAALCGQRHDPLPTFHPEQCARGATSQESACAYRQLLAEATSEKDLADIERGFRVLKSDLDIATVFHRLPDRIRAHALICFLALVLYRVMRLRLKANGHPAGPKTALEVLRRLQEQRVQIGPQRLTGIGKTTTQQLDLFQGLGLNHPRLSARCVILDYRPIAESMTCTISCGTWE